VQLALLLMAVFFGAFICGILIFELYWSQVLPSLSPDVRQVVENIRPAPRIEWNRETFALRPGVVSLLFGVGLIVVCSVLLSRWLLAPLNALERTVERIVGQDVVRVPSHQTPKLFGHVVEQIKTLAARLEQSEEARRIANAAIAHELRTPLSSLRARIENLEYGVFAATPAEIAKLHPNLDLLERLVEDLQTLSFDLQLELQETAWLPLLEAVCTENPRRADIRLIVQPIKAQLDAKRMRQVMYNLLENANRYTKVGSPIEVQLKAEANQFVLTVSDAGEGVEDALLPQLFTPFYRVEPSRSRAHGGSGLGLAVVQKIVEAHGGVVSAHRARLGGLAVRVVLPHSPVENTSTSR
jgi:two-component system, OmpR family, sensor histidine kinase BaeS